MTKQEKTLEMRLQLFQHKMFSLAEELEKEILNKGYSRKYYAYFVRRLREQIKEAQKEMAGLEYIDVVE